MSPEVVARLLKTLRTSSVSDDASLTNAMSMVNVSLGVGVGIPDGSSGVSMPDPPSSGLGIGFRPSG